MMMISSSFSSSLHSPNLLLSANSRRNTTPGLFRVVGAVRASSSTRRTARFRGGSFFGAFLSSSSSERAFPRLLRRLSRGAKSLAGGGGGVDGVETLNDKIASQAALVKGLKADGKTNQAEEVKAAVTTTAREFSGALTVAQEAQALCQLQRSSRL